MRGLLGAAVFFSALAAAAADEGDDPYVYQRLPSATPARLELETAVGTRDARVFGARGVEETGRALWAPLERLEITATGSLLVLGDGDRAGGGLEASVLAFGDAARGLKLGGGVARDLRDAWLVRARAVAFTHAGPLSLVASALAELPIAAPGRDDVDLVFGVAASLPLADRLRGGIELLGEDLEGLWDAEEAEGGARFLAAPTLWIGLGGGVDLKLSSGLHVDGAGAGFLGRLTLGFGWR